MVERQMMMSGEMPMDRNSATLCWVGFDFCSPLEDR
jgi:hypothetical protein